MYTAPRAKGFTLIEVMVVVAIIGILAAIAYPSYRDQIARSRRADAKAALLERAQWMERQFSISGKYTKLANGGTLNTAALPPLQAGSTTAALYTLGFATGSPTDTTFTLQMVPVAGAAMASDACGTFTVTHTGDRTPSSASLYKLCWEK